MGPFYVCKWASFKKLSKDVATWIIAIRNTKSKVSAWLSQHDEQLGPSFDTKQFHSLANMTIWRPFEAIWRTDVSDTSALTFHSTKGWRLVLISVWISFHSYSGCSNINYFHLNLGWLPISTRGNKTLSSSSFGCRGVLRTSIVSYIQPSFPCMTVTLWHTQLHRKKGGL